MRRCSTKAPPRPREQHSRREKATSNVCTAQALLAVMASMYGVFHGPDGLRAIAAHIHRKLMRLIKGLETLGFSVEPASFFDTVSVECGPSRDAILASALREGINLRLIGETRIGRLSGAATPRRSGTPLAATWPMTS